MPVTITNWPDVAATVEAIEKAGDELVAIAEGPEGLYVFSKPKRTTPAKKQYETRGRR